MKERIWISNHSLLRLTAFPPAFQFFFFFFFLRKKTSSRVWRKAEVDVNKIKKFRGFQADLYCFSAEMKQFSNHDNAASFSSSAWFINKSCRLTCKADASTTLWQSTLERTISCRCKDDRMICVSAHQSGMLTQLTRTIFLKAPL